MTLPGRGTRQHNTDEAPRANPCARGIDRNNRKGRGRRSRRPRGSVSRQMRTQASPQGAGRRIGTRPQRRAGGASAGQRQYVPSQNAWAYFTIVEHAGEVKFPPRPIPSPPGAARPRRGTPRRTRRGRDRFRAAAVPPKALACRRRSSSRSSRSSRRSARTNECFT